MSLEDTLHRLEEERLSAGILLAFRRPVPVPTREQIEAAEERLGVRFHPDYRLFLERASHRLFGPLEPAVVSLPGSEIDLVAVAERGWKAGVPRRLLPICEHGKTFFCLEDDGAVVHWQGTLDGAQTWPDLASWLEQAARYELLEPTGDRRVDEILKGVIGVFEAQFPGRVESYYLEGSHGGEQAVTTSDIDLTLLFKTQPDALETRRIARAREACQRLCPQLDIRVRGLDLARRFGAYSFNVRGRLLRGREVRDQVPLLPLEDYLRTCLHAPYYFMCANLRGRRGLPFPLAYPDPEGEFFGYDTPLRRTLDGVERPGTKDFVVAIVWAARALALLVARRHLSARNSDGVRLYREWVGDRWTPLLEEILEQCRNAWGYLVPEDAAARRRLRQLCADALGFENHYLERYKGYLIEQLERAGEPRSYWLGLGAELGTAGADGAGLDETTPRLFALGRLEQLRFDDPAVTAAIERARSSGHEAVRTAAEKALERLAT